MTNQQEKSKIIQDRVKCKCGCHCNKRLCQEKHGGIICSHCNKSEPINKKHFIKLAHKLHKEPEKDCPLCNKSEKGCDCPKDGEWHLPNCGEPLSKEGLYEKNT